MSTMPFTSGTCWCSMASMPWRSVTSAIPHPWHPPAMRTMTTASCTSISSTRPPCRATIGFTWLSNRSATRSYKASSATLPVPAGAAGFDRTARWPPPRAPRIARPPRGRGHRAHLPRRLDHVAERQQRLLPAARLQPAVGVHPDLAVAEHFLHALERLHDFRRARHAGRVDIVDTRPDLVGIAVFLEPLEQLRPRAREIGRAHV